MSDRVWMLLAPQENHMDVRLLQRDESTYHVEISDTLEIEVKGEKKTVKLLTPVLTVVKTPETLKRDKLRLKAQVKAAAEKIG